LKDTTLQVWRASPSLLENVEVFIQSYGMKQKINSLWSVNLIDWQTLKIECRDKSVLWSVEKWIHEAKIWLTPQNMWEYIIVKIPPLTQERRTDLTKLVQKMWEDSKIALRNIRQDWIKDLKKSFEEKLISEDEKKQWENDIDETTKNFSKKIDELAKNKSEEIMKI
jgi:ribosome recycling factor